jgi:hypothetical protein
LSWFVPALLGFFGGVVGSLVAPWVHWAIEKRRSKSEYRRQIIAQWRSEIDAFNWDDDDFGNTTTYGGMRSHMTPEIVKSFETQRTFHVAPDGGRGELLKKQWASDEVSKIESIWGLL